MGSVEENKIVGLVFPMWSIVLRLFHTFQGRNDINEMVPLILQWNNPDIFIVFEKIMFPVKCSFCAYDLMINVFMSINSIQLYTLQKPEKRKACYCWSIFYLIYSGSQETRSSFMHIRSYCHLKTPCERIDSFKCAEMKSTKLFILNQYHEIFIL